MMTRAYLPNGGGIIGEDTAVRTLFLIVAALLIAPAALAAPVFPVAGGDGSVDLVALSIQHRNELLAVIIFGCLIATALLLPDFDGRNDEDFGDGPEGAKPY
jgi:hypothetical protein